MIIVNGFQPLTIITKRSILNGAAVLDPPLKLKQNGVKGNLLDTLTNFLNDRKQKLDTLTNFQNDRKQRVVLNGQQST